MKKRLALAAVSAATLAMMAGPAALTVAAQDTETDVRVETGWMKHDKALEGRGHAWGRIRLFGEADHRRKGKEHRKDDGEKERRRSIFGAPHDADLSATETAAVRAAVETKQTSILGAVKSRMEAAVAAMEAKNAAVLDAWTIEDREARNEALAEARLAAKEDRTEIRTTFKASVKAAYETFRLSIRSILGL